MQQPIIYLTGQDLFVMIVVIAAVLGTAVWRRRMGDGRANIAPIRRAHRAGERIVALFDEYAHLAGRIAAIQAAIEQQGQFMPPELKAQLTAEVAAAYARLKKIHDRANAEVHASSRERPDAWEDDVRGFIDQLMNRY